MTEHAIYNSLREKLLNYEGDDESLSAYITDVLIKLKKQSKDDYTIVTQIIASLILHYRICETGAYPDTFPYDAICSNNIQIDTSKLPKPLKNMLYTYLQTL